MYGVGSTKKKRPAWPFVLALSGLIACNEPRPGLAQSPTPASTVSPAIERFVRASGRDVPPPVPSLPQSALPMPSIDPVTAPRVDRSSPLPAYARGPGRRPGAESARPAGLRHDVEAGSVRAGPIAGSRSAWQPLCGSPTPGHWSSPPPRPASGSPRPS